jgi:S-adenosyl methyltransferase
VTESSSSGDPGRIHDVPEIDTSVAHVARVYDYLLGGETNFAVDREAAHASHANVPGGVQTSMAYVQANRRFLGRAVRYLATEAGIRQFLDLGSGIPTADNVHQVAQRVVPESRVVYVDDDPIVLAHSHELMESTPEGIAYFVPRDLRDVEAVLAETTTVLDLSQPVAVMLVSMLHLSPDESDPYSIVPPYMAAVPSGSYLVLSHLAGESAEMTELGKGIDDNPTFTYSLTVRTHDQVARFFDGLELVEPGLVMVDRWRPDPGQPGAGAPFHGGVARKP